MDEVGINFARRECAVHSIFDHVNVVKLYEYTENDQEFVLFMEYCNDANYFDDKLVEVSPTIKKQTHYRLRQLAPFPRELFSEIVYLREDFRKKTNK